MSNKLLTDSPSDLPTDAAPPKVRPPMRRVWLVSGFVLWTLVFVAALALVLVGRSRRAAQNKEDQAAARVLIMSDGTATKGPTPAAGGLSPAGLAAGTPLPSPWDAAGIADFTFTERSGRKVTKADLLGHPWLIAFIFTRCAGPCPRVTGQMAELQTLLKGTDVKLVTLTVDPDHDTTSVLSHYADVYRADPKQWLYLTGDKNKTYELIQKSFKMPVREYTGADREPGYEVMHSTNILLVNEKGVVVHKYNALSDVDMVHLRHDLRPYLDAKHALAPAQGAGKGTRH